MYRTDFWLEAAPDPVLQVDPEAALPAEASMATLNVTGVVVNHAKLAAGDGDFAIDLLVDDGQQGKAVTLRYNLGLNRRIAVERATLVQLELWQSRDAPAGPVRAMLMHALSSGVFGRRQVPVVVLQANGLIPVERLPAALRQIEQDEEIAYQSADRGGGDCLKAAAHRWFRIDATPGSAEPAAQSRHPPGARITMTDRRDRFDVLLGDNRETLASECPDTLAQYCVWSAVWTPPPAGTRVNPQDLIGLRLNVGAANALPLPVGATPVTAPQDHAKPPGHAAKPGHTGKPK